MGQEIKGNMGPIETKFAVMEGIIAEIKAISENLEKRTAQICLPEATTISDRSLNGTATSSSICPMEYELDNHISHLRSIEDRLKSILDRMQI